MNVQFWALGNVYISWRYAKKFLCQIRVQKHPHKAFCLKTCMYIYVHRGVSIIESSLDDDATIVIKY